MFSWGVMKVSSCVLPPPTHPKDRCCWYPHQVSQLGACRFSESATKAGQGVSVSRKLLKNRASSNNHNPGVLGSSRVTSGIQVSYFPQSYRSFCASWSLNERSNLPGWLQALVFPRPKSRPSREWLSRSSVRPLGGVRATVLCSQVVGNQKSSPIRQLWEQPFPTTEPALSPSLPPSSCFKIPKHL